MLDLQKYLFIVFALFLKKIFDIETAALEGKRLEF